LGSGIQHSGSSENQEVDLELRLSLWPLLCNGLVFMKLKRSRIISIWYQIS
jgi:hypothetical protein